MAVTASTAPKSVSRVYGRQDGARVVLLYADRNGAHRVTQRPVNGEAETWRCPNVEVARTRWAALVEQLRDRGFELVNPY